MNETKEMLNLANKRTMALSVIFTIMLFTGLASAETYVLAEDKLHLVTELQGTDITYGEFIQELFPEAYDKSPSPAKAMLYDTKMKWHSEETKSEETITSYDKTNTKSIPWGMHSISEISASGSDAEFSSSQNIFFPSGAKASTMEVVTMLYKYNTEDPLATVLETGTNVNKLEAEDSFTVTTSGSYKTKGMHAVTWPPGYWPQYGYTETESSWKYISS